MGILFHVVNVLLIVLNGIEMANKEIAQMNNELLIVLNGIEMLSDWLDNQLPSNF